MFGRDRDKIRILGDIIEPIGVMVGSLREGEDVGDRRRTLGIYENDLAFNLTLPYLYLLAGIAKQTE